MRVIGLFRELGGQIDASTKSIYSMLGQLPQDEMVPVVRYLRSGVPVFDIMEATIDPLDRVTHISGGPSLVSDGTWIWRNDLVYFVEKYRIGLPADFVLYASQAVVFNGEVALVTGKWEQILQLYERAEKTGESHIEDQN
ncbi:hypothetical protein [Silvimonas soli]|uniref:hypothetical protein n=1 Tax=Silvimonas soli TaxID=2980100 RepID=UPI0024B36669|nr:hypothetical protein [Silvimonas soli]